MSNFSRPAAAHYLSFPFTCTHFVNEDSYPEIRAQRNAAEYGGFLLSGLARRAAAGFVGFGYCIGVVYILLGVETKTRTK